MRLICADPGASWSTADVFRGLVPQLRALGHECLEYAFSRRLDAQRLMLNYAWRRAGKPAERPNAADLHYLASVGMIEQALLFEADGLLIFSGMFVPRQVLQMARRAGIRSGLVLSESPYDQEHEASWVAEVDAAWTNERTSVRFLRFRSGNPNVHYLQHAFDPERHTPTSQIEDNTLPRHDVVFVGSAFEERLETLQAVNWDGIDLGLYGNWQMLGSRSKLREFLRDGIVDNQRTAGLYRQSKVGLNLLRTSIGWGRGAPRITNAESLNPRALELAACGAFQISDYRAEVAEIFGDAVPTYRTPAELESIIRHALSDDEWRQQCATNAALAVARPEFTFAARAAQVSDQLYDAWSSRIAAA